LSERLVELDVQAHVLLPRAIDVSHASRRQRAIAR
jgi:hypothetical protein